MQVNIGSVSEQTATEQYQRHIGSLVVLVKVGNNSLLDFYARIRSNTVQNVLRMCHKFSSHQHARRTNIAHSCCPQTNQIAKNVSMMKTAKEVITVAIIQSP